MIKRSLELRRFDQSDIFINSLVLLILIINTALPFHHILCIHAQSVISTIRSAKYLLIFFQEVECAFADQRKYTRKCSVTPNFKGMISIVRYFGIISPCRIMKPNNELEVNISHTGDFSGYEYLAIGILVMGVACCLRLLSEGNRVQCPYCCSSLIYHGHHIVHNC